LPSNYLFYCSELILQYYPSDELLIILRKLTLS